jgi:hypothetical protein
MTERHFQFMHDKLPYFARRKSSSTCKRANSFTRFSNRARWTMPAPCARPDPRALRQARAGHEPVHRRLQQLGLQKQFRLKDGTLARERPQAVSLWADDMYMGVPALAEMGHLTGKREYFDDAVKNVLQMTGYLFNPQNGLYTHGWNANNPDAPRFYWARANGWAVLTMSDLLDVLPKDHPGYPKVLAQLRCPCAASPSSNRARPVAPDDRPPRLVSGNLGQRHVHLRDRTRHQ